MHTHRDLAESADTRESRLQSWDERLNLQNQIKSETGSQLFYFGRGWRREELFTDLYWTWDVLVYLKEQSNSSGQKWSARIEMSQSVILSLCGVSDWKTADFLSYAAFRRQHWVQNCSPLIHFKDATLLIRTLQPRNSRSSGKNMNLTQILLQHGVMSPSEVPWLLIKYMQACSPETWKPAYLATIQTEN